VAGPEGSLKVNAKSNNTAFAGALKARTLPTARKAAAADLTEIILSSNMD
jgi:hypothetical protein